MPTDINYHLFGGEHAYCLPGMDGYIGPYEEIELAQMAAESAHYDWVHIASITPLGIKVIQVGRYSPATKSIVWQADYSPQSDRDRLIKTFCSVMKAGTILIGLISVSRRGNYTARMRIMTNALKVYDDIQSQLGSMPVEEQNSSLYLARQVLKQMIVCMRRAQLSHKEKLDWNRWVSNANALLSSTKDMQLFEDRWEKI